MFHLIKSLKCRLFSNITLCVILSLICSSQLVFATYDVSIQSLDNKTVRLSALKEDFVFIDFWATWCPPCIKGMMKISKILKKETPKNCVFCFVSLDNNISAAQNFIEKNYPQFKTDPRIHLLFNGESRLAEKFNVTGIPSLFLLNTKARSGEHVIWKHEGLPSTQDIQNALQKVKSISLKKSHQ